MPGSAWRACGCGGGSTRFRKLRAISGLSAPTSANYCKSWRFSCYRDVAFVIAGCICYRSEEHTSELQSLMRISYAVFCLKKKKKIHHNYNMLIQSTKKNQCTVETN